MKLREATVKELLSAEGASIPRGVVVSSAEEVADAISHVGLPAIIKANSRFGQRWKAGLVMTAESVGEAQVLTSSLLGREHEGETITSVLIESRVNPSHEIYLVIMLDEMSGCPVLRLALHGGVAVESAVRQDAADIRSLAIDPIFGLRTFEMIPVLKSLGFSGATLPGLAATIHKCWQAFNNRDATLLEVNPIGLDMQGNVFVLDAKMTVDDAALFRNPDLRSDASTTRGDQTLRPSHQHVRYTELGGNIAILSGGAGMTMAIADAIIHFGGTPANFLDTIGGADADGAAALASVVLEKVANDHTIRALLLNLSLVASPMAPFVNGFERAFHARPPRVPVVGVVRGTGAATASIPLSEARTRIRALGVILFDTIEQAVRASVARARDEETA